MFNLLSQFNLSSLNSEASISQQNNYINMIKPYEVYINNKYQKVDFFNFCFAKCIKLINFFLKKFNLKIRK